MAQVLVVAEVADGVVRKTTFELLTIARRLGEPAVVVFTDPAGAAEAAALAPAFAEYGAGTVYLAQAEALLDHLVVGKAEALAAVVATAQGAGGVAAVLIGSTAEGKEIAARLAITLESGLITDAVDVQEGPGGVPVTTQSAFAGGFAVTARVTRGVPLITVKPSSATAEPAAGGSATVVPVTVTLSELARAVRIVERKDKEASGRPDLSEASIVVSGGRGTGGDFAPVEAFADAVGAAVGASRAAVDAGWYPHSHQVGQTGKQVSPQLYVACGISGAIQHRAGMQTSKTIVAINKDAEAPIFELADFGVVGDLFAVLPQATTEVKAHRG